MVSSALAAILLDFEPTLRYNARGMAGKRHISVTRWVSLGLLAAGAVGLCVLVAQGQGARGAVNTAAKPGHMYDAGHTPEMMPEALLPGLILLTPEQLARVPEVDGFESPCGARNGAMTYDAQPFGSPNESRGGQHLASDINGIGGENSDQGEPVRAAARGLVVYSGEPSPSWGNVVVLAHRLPGTNRVVQTLYAHLEQRRVRTGELVGRGSRIGSIGTAHGQYLAHLHLEAVESRCTEAGLPGYSAHGTMNRLDPEQLFAQYPAPATPDAYESLRRRQFNAQAMQQPHQLPVESLPEGSLRLSPSQFLKN